MCKKYMNTQKEIEVRQVLMTLLPAMEADGGGVELVAIEEDCIKVRFRGACLLCPSINLTMKFGLVKTLQDKLPWVKQVLKVD